MEGCPGGLEDFGDFGLGGSGGVSGGAGGPWGTAAPLGLVDASSRGWTFMALPQGGPWPKKKGSKMLQERNQRRHHLKFVIHLEPKNGCRFPKFPMMACEWVANERLVTWRRAQGCSW